jgi:hypothetical protein
MSDWEGLDFPQQIRDQRSQDVVRNATFLRRRQKTLASGSQKRKNQLSVNLLCKNQKHQRSKNGTCRAGGNVSSSVDKKGFGLRSNHTFWFVIS